MLGVAVSHVFDGTKEVGGQQMRGVEVRPRVGFLSLLEHYNYVKVGDFLKCPRLPVWLVGSESHYTVLFRWEDGVIPPLRDSQSVDLVSRAPDPLSDGGVGSVGKDARALKSSPIEFALPINLYYYDQHAG